MSAESEKNIHFQKSIRFRPIRRFFPRNQPFSAVFAIKNIRKRDRVILVFLTERILSYDHVAKEKTQKSWKLDFWRNFKVWNFEFLVNFSLFFRKNLDVFRKICTFCYPRSFMIFSSIILRNVGEKISDVPQKLKILQTIFQNPTYITLFGIFLEKWNNIVFVYLILLEILCWVRIWFRFWCATNGSPAIAQNVSF